MTSTKRAGIIVCSIDSVSVAIFKTPFSKRPWISAFLVSAKRGDRLALLGDTLFVSIADGVASVVEFSVMLVMACSSLVSPVKSVRFQGPAVAVSDVCCSVSCERCGRRMGTMGIGVGRLWRVGGAVLCILLVLFVLFWFWVLAS